ncbi:hypothetical protein C8Q79DRAFT_1053364 [Trametes meyenii]|nr:hypothetical protein C8Q79DRAFT_1053364 [Trametes meyenii]
MPYPPLCFLVWLLVLTGSGCAQLAKMPFLPAAVPLAIRSPFMNVWYMTNNSAPPMSNAWPMFWTNKNVPMRESVMGWTGKLYSDISAEWLSGDRSSQVRWGSHNTTRGNTYHEIYLQSPVPGAEIEFQAQDGKAYYAMAARPNQTWQIDHDDTVRNQFMSQGRLTNTSSTNFATISPTYSVYAISVDLGQIQSTSNPVTWAIGYVRDPTISFAASDGSMQELGPYFTTEYARDVGLMIDAVVTSFGNVYSRAVVFDQSIVGNASLVSPHYADLVSLVTRQTFSALDITVPSGTMGQPAPSDVRIFMKDIGSSDSTERVTPVERLYAALPAFVYVNASMLGPLLKPLLDAQANSKGLQYAARDLGKAYPFGRAAYPNATAATVTDTHNYGVERNSSESGNMLILLYAHAKFSGDGTLIYRHYNLAKRWSKYLINQAGAPADQESADGESTSNMTNLAIKGIIGVAAMAEISRALGQESDAQQFDSHAFYTDQKRLLGVYGDTQSWALLYNIYADRLLGTSIVSDTLLQQRLSSTTATTSQFGIAIDNTIQQASTAWTLLTAATVTDNAVRDRLIEGVWNRANLSTALGAFPDNYQLTSGATVDGEAGPAAGAMFSLLALNVSSKPIVIPPSTSDVAVSGQSDAGVIAGGVIGGVFLFLVIVSAFFLLRKRRRDRKEQEQPRVARMHELHGLFMERPAPPSPSSYPDPIASTNPPSDAPDPSSCPLPPSTSVATVPSATVARKRARMLGSSNPSSQRQPVSTQTNTVSAGMPPTEFATGGPQETDISSGPSNGPTTPHGEMVVSPAEMEQLRLMVQEMRGETEPLPAYTD